MKFFQIESQHFDSKTKDSKRLCDGEREREREREREKENREIGWTGFELSFYELDCEQEQSVYKIDHDKFLFFRFLCKKRENREREGDKRNGCGFCKS